MSKPIHQKRNVWLGGLYLETSNTSLFVANNRHRMRQDGAYDQGVSPERASNYLAAAGSLSSNPLTHDRARPRRRSNRLASGAADDEQNVDIRVAPLIVPSRLR